MIRKHSNYCFCGISQDLFFNLWNNRSKLSDIRLFQSYLYQMARNILYNYFDHSLVQEKYEMAQFLSPSVSDDPEEQLFASNLQELINLRVDQMPPQRRQIFRMSRMEGLNNEEIANRLNINKRTVRFLFCSFFTNSVFSVKKSILDCV